MPVRKKIHLLLLILSCASLVSDDLFAQCSGGVLAGNIVPTTAWTSTATANVIGGSYYTFNATAGFTYYFSFCPADGGNTIYDTQITILNNAGTFVGGS